jgi:hypothetical protein
MRQRASKAYNLYSDNLKIYNRLSNCKSTIPSLEVMVKKSTQHDKLLKSMSHFMLKQSSRKEGGLIVIKKENPISEFDRGHSKIRLKTIKLQL